MKSLATAFILWMIGWVLAFADDPGHLEMESRAALAVQKLLLARHGPQGGLQCWAGRARRSLEVTDEALLGAMIPLIRQDKPSATSLSAANPYVAAQVAGWGMELYPGNPTLEAVIMDEIRNADLAKQEDTFLLNKVANLGSDELVRESKGLITDSRRLERFDREVGGRSQPRFERNRFPEGVRFENWVEQRTSMGFLPQAVALLLLYSVAVWLVVFITRRKWARIKLIGTVAILTALCLAALWPWLRGIRWNPKSDNQTVVFGRRGSGPLSPEDMAAFFRNPDGAFYKVADVKHGEADTFFDANGKKLCPTYFTPPQSVPVRNRFPQCRASSGCAVLATSLGLGVL